MVTASPAGLLAALPPPPAGRAGWPWTEETPPPPPRMPDGRPWPRITVVTPSYNQGAYLEHGIRSVLLQNYPDLELLVFDGGSADGTVEVLRRYGAWIAHWESGPDRGQAHALNKGFGRASGALVGWQNSDDWYGPGSFRSGALAWAAAPEADVYHGEASLVDEAGRLVQRVFTGEFRLADARETFPLFPFANQAMLFNRRLFERGMLLDESYRNGMDADFIVRVIAAGGAFRSVPGLSGFCLVHAAAKSSRQLDVGLADVNRVCAAVFANPAAGPELRAIALRAWGRNLATCFRRGMRREVLANVRPLAAAGGVRPFTPKMVARVLLSLLRPGGGR